MAVQTGRHAFECIHLTAVSPDLREPSVGHVTVEKLELHSAACIFCSKRYSSKHTQAC